MFSPQASAAYNSLHTGYATYTGSGYSGGALLLDPIPSNMKITALNPTDMNYRGVKAALAGAYLRVEGPKGKRPSMLPICILKERREPLTFHRTLSRDRRYERRQIDIKWRIVKAPITGNFTYRIKEGSSQWWAAIQVRNHKYPVMKWNITKTESGSTWRNGLQPFRQHQSRDKSA
ncbi:expansin EXLX1 family cellulose-binding protein [Bacillus licheniformis]|nr:expansin EXLX1 family cellulose-binding protein [Bacillus licheniformis]